jgi:hypothetical protein
MAIFTAIAAAIGLTGFWATAFVTVASIATSVGLSYAAKALAGDPQTDTPNVAQGVQGTLQAGADTPRSFNLGYSVTAGSLVYANTWGNTVIDENNTPNAYLTQVIAIADLPGGTLEEVWVNGELCTLGAVADSSKGYPVTQYNKEGADHLWIKYYDGTQTTADSFLTGTVSSAARPYESTRVGTGVAYVICTSLVSDTLFSGFPTFKFAVSGIPLYDPTKDDTNGGTGSHRWSNPSTWGGDGDNLPAVQIYNVLRGIYHNGVWLYGLQRMTAARLPAANWNAQIAKCRATVTGTAGAEPTYRTGGQISVANQIVHTVEALLTGCQGRLSEIGGFYKIHLGAPDSPTFAFTDDDIISTEEQHFAPFFGLADSINGITATYPSPAEGWNNKVAPPLYNSDFEAEDGARRLLANPAFDFVPYDAQVQRLQKSALQEARRARRHSLVLPPPFWIVEPGDVGEWTSERNGYTTKQFRVDGLTDKTNLDVLFNLTEVDPTDYDWDHATDYTPVTIGPTTLPRPAPQGIVDWFAEPYTLLDTGGAPRRPAIRIAWDGNMPGVIGVQYEVRLTSSAVVVTRNRTDQLAVGSLIVTQSLLPDTAYEVRGQYLPSAPRDMLWSDWLAVTTPDVKLGLVDFDAALIALIEGVEQFNGDAIDEALNKIASIAANQDARNWLDKKELRTQLSARSEDALAQIEEVRTVAVDAGAAFASFSATATATWGSTTAFVTDSATAIATLDGYAAAAYSVTLDVNGYATGFELVNGGGGISAFVVTTDKFQIAAPSITGGDAVPIFTVANVNGVPKTALRGDVYADGTMHARAIEAGSISATEIAANAVTAAKINAGSIDTNKIAINGVDILNIVAGAATQQVTQNYNISVGIGQFVSTSATIKSGTATVTWLLDSITITAPASAYNYIVQLIVDGVVQRTWSFTGAAGVNYTTPCTMVADITGLSNASHTFALSHSATNGAAIGTVVGMLRVQDLRR